MGLCPFHKEKSPSFTVAEDKQIFKCFGCGKGGSAITFHMEIERLDFWDSLQILAKDANIDISSYQKDPEKQAADKSIKEKQKLLNKRTQQFFEQNFPNSKAQEYAQHQRKLTQKTIETFQIWYAPDSFDALVTLLWSKWFNAEDMVGAWIASIWKKTDPYAFFRHRLTFPIHDHMWTIVGFGGRALDPDQNPKYLNTTETALYNKSNILYGLDKAKDHIKSLWYLIIVEWYMDVVALHQYGLPIWIATCGTALTPSHTKLIRRHTEHLVFAFDNDDPGFEATIRGLKVAYEQDIYPKILVFPEIYKDVDEWLWDTQEDHKDMTEETWKEKLDSLSVDGFKRTLSQQEKRNDLQDPIQRKRSIQTMFELLSKIDDYAILQMYFTQVAETFAVHEEQLWKQFRQWIKKASVRNTTYRDDQDDKTKRPESSSKIQEKYLLGVLVYKDIALQLWAQAELYSKYKEILTMLAGHFPTTILAEVISEKVSWDTQEKLVEAEMFRDLQLANLEEEKKNTVIHWFLHKQIYKLQRVVLKSKSLSNEHKQELLTKIRSL